MTLEHCLSCVRRRVSVTALSEIGSWLLMHCHGGLVSEKNVMHVRQIAESGSYARFFFQLIAMYLIVSGLAFCLIAAAYAELRPLKPSGGTFISKNLRE